MFSPLGAIASAGTGFLEGKRQSAEDLQKQYEMMGIEALGRAFQAGPGPMDQMNARGPQPPMPGEASMPTQPQPPMRVATNGAPIGQPPPMAPPGPPQGPQGFPQPSPPAPTGAGGTGAPPAAGSMPPGMAAGGMPPQGGGGPGGMPQLDLQTLAQRIAARNPNLPPQAMLYALKQAEPMLTSQARLELTRLELGMQRERLGETQRHNRVMEGTGTGGGQQPSQDGTVGGYSPDAVDAAAERFRNTGQMPPGLRDRAGGNALRTAIANRAAEMDRIEGVKPTDRLKRQQEFKAEQIAIQRFMSGKQGDTVRSLGVVVDHLGTMRELTQALQNNDIQAFNRIANAFAEQTGQPAPTNAATAAQIVGAEVIKSLGIAGAGTKEERQEAANAFARAKSPQQLMEAIDKVVKPLMLGQLKGMRRQFKTATGLPESKFDELLGDEAKQFFAGGGKEGGGGPKVGTVEDGYRFKGGDPKKPESWEKVQ